MISPEHRAVFSAQLQRRRGRPGRGTPVVQTTVKLPTDVFDTLCRRATELREPSLHALMVRVLASYAGARNEFR